MSEYRQELEEKIENIETMSSSTSDNAIGIGYITLIYRILIVDICYL